VIQKAKSEAQGYDNYDEEDDDEVREPCMFT
jgi:hypothetical protein